MPWFYAGGLGRRRPDTKTWNEHKSLIISNVPGEVFAGHVLFYGMLAGAKEALQTGGSNLNSLAP